MFLPNDVIRYAAPAPGPHPFPGSALTDAGSHSRTNKAAYVDLSGQPAAGWTVDLAGRYEHFSDFGNAKVGKLTSRCDFSPVVGVRATYSNSTPPRSPTWKRRRRACA
jgi:iron complex outermembrane receptor protein